VHLIKTNQVETLAWLDADNNICARALFGNGTCKRFTTKHITSQLQTYSVRFTGDTVCFMDYDRKIFLLSKIGNDSVIVKETYDLTSFLKSRNCEIDYQAQNIFEIQYPYLILPLLSNIREDNFIYPSAYAKIELQNAGQTQLKALFLHTPRKYYKRKEYNTDKFFRFLNDTTFVYGFQTFDSIYAGRLSTAQITQKADFNGAAEYRVFDHSKVMNRAYVRWHVNTNETNLNMFTANGNIVIIKQRQRKELNDSTLYEYFVLNRQLQPLYHAAFTHTFDYRLSFPYKKGFIVISPKQKKAYYYEIPV
jgi:hypothetical protein